jgi:hypothetical protein
MASNENTPLSSGSTPLNAEAISSFAKNVFSKENFENAARVAKERAGELQKQAHAGGFSMRLLALSGGILLVLVSGMQFLGNLLTLNIIGAIIELYTFLLGVVVIILEGKTVFLTDDFINRIHKFALFLKYLWGRGCLYFIAGSLQIYQGYDLFNLVSGGYMCFVGALMVFVGQRTALKLKEMRKSLYSEQTLRSKFNEANTDGGEGLTLAEFRTFTQQSLNLDMNRRETEAAFLHLAKANSERLGFDEFLSWWNESNAEDNMEENAFVFV